MENHDITLVRQVLHLYMLFALLALPNATQAEGGACANNPAQLALVAACVEGNGTGRGISMVMPTIL